MPPFLRKLLAPLNLAALLTWLTVALSLRMPTTAPAVAWGLLFAYLAAFLACDWLPAQRWRAVQAGLHLLQAGCALGVIWYSARVGAAPVLLVILVAQLAMAWPARVTLAAVLALDLVLYLVLRQAGHPAPALVTMLYAGFQAFAALVSHYARSAEASRDRLALVNADLLATRALLADTARDTERLRVARELHDVAGHKLTAMTLNLRALAEDPALATRAEVDVALQLSQELLGDIRDVVHALRDVRGLDLSTALHALAAPLPRPALRLAIASDVRIHDPAVADTILRVVQEALTNSARHGLAAALHVDLHRDGAVLALNIEDDGRLHGSLREGSGLAGMRERIEALGGAIAFGVGETGALRISATLPA